MVTGCQYLVLCRSRRWLTRDIVAMRTLDPSPVFESMTVYYTFETTKKPSKYKIGRTSTDTASARDSERHACDETLEYIHTNVLTRGGDACRSWMRMTTRQLCTSPVAHATSMPFGCILAGRDTILAGEILARNYTILDKSNKNPPLIRQARLIFGGWRFQQQQSDLALNTLHLRYKTGHVRITALT